ncbi:MAG: tRNA uridine(34) 5-carboxymethylaminomethyl modification radical SAM/GNAT enzyme Elp3 [Parcubacteria group bacterium]|nr:tRNA uridine(34) 5-carboxymethylaminomethyl modification radical SAM/GNAT enzyme Elp3 [Parcubacteria group bacterium]
MTIKQKQNRKKAIHELLSCKIKSRGGLMALKRKLAKKYGQPILAHAEILKEYKKLLAAGTIHKSPEQEKILRKRAVRTLSGIAPVAVLTKPYACPGQCVYCPSEPGVPQSYLSNEPAVMRARRCNYEPYKQVELRLRALETNGHEPTKIELIVIGGTWSVLPEEYKYWYIWQCFKAANEYEKNQNWSVIPAVACPVPRYGEPESRVKRAEQVSGLRVGARNDKWEAKVQNLKQKLLQEQKKNESAKYKIIGLTLETRPDYIEEKELWQMRELGATRVELGAQALNDKILKLNKRGHGVAEIARATALLKNYGFKVSYHIMPGLPGATAKKDLAMFKKLFSDERFQPDQLKFYPTVVTRGSLLYQWWQAGKYQPYSDKILYNLITACKIVVPPYVRLIRLIRDIPAESIMAGNLITNLRQVMKDRGVKCRCIRCREAGDKKFSIFNFQFSIIEYKASNGIEYFLSYESKDKKVLYGFCRLRLGMPNETAMIRELHVYGELVPIGGNKKIQHAGLGKRLMAEAEKIARNNGYKKMAVIAGVGVRGYYRKLGYKLQNSYMIKSLV